MNTKTAADQAIATFREHGGILRTIQARALGIHPRTLYSLRDEGRLERLGRGLYRLADLPPLTRPDLVAVALRVPRGVICALSALAYHELTTQIPHAVDLALRAGDQSPRLAHPPIRVFRFSGPAWEEGIETHQIDGVGVRIYSPAKSVADAFKLRKQIGADVALEALKAYRQSERFDVSELIHCARVCRVEAVMRPYLEALL